MSEPYAPLHCCFCGGHIEVPLFFHVPWQNHKDGKWWCIVVPCCSCCAEDQTAQDLRRRWSTWWDQGKEMRP